RPAVAARLAQLCRPSYGRPVMRAQLCGPSYAGESPPACPASDPDWVEAFWLDGAVGADESCDVEVVGAVRGTGGASNSYDPPLLRLLSTAAAAAAPPMTKPTNNNFFTRERFRFGLDLADSGR